ncbi:cadherin-related family member 5 isoform X2 [Microcaecilia unicolor]|uniref:Cadherin-related family member 5 isoform X2 n=1 Tax=Microcaecilia unicolor TaxID=1415580 RepID=A0A6P7Y2S8_9AMPH|nr:cadherin-related family member 5 isoform X2 [Microcaecilia unicolor]
MSYTLHTHTMAVISAHQGTSLLLLVLSIAPALAQSDTGCWVNDTRVRIEENNPPGYVVTTLRATPGYNLSISSEGQSKEFEIRWPNLILKESLDYEVLPDTVFFVDLQCDDESGITVKTFVIVVEIENVNDEAPQFSQTEIIRNVSEDTQVDSPIGSPIYAEDPDKDVLFYALNGTVEALDHFILMSANNPTIIVRQALDYDTIKYLQLLLYARDTELPGANNHTATATIHVNILEADTKPPWFQPCTFPNGNSKLCISNGYESWVNVSEQASGALVLKPGPLYAIDGDTGINEPITYEIISGNQEDIFSIDNVSGNITMKKAASTLGITIFQVLASQVNDPLKYALTSVQIHVIEKSNFPPRFQSSLYHGTVPTHTDSGSLVMEYGSSNKPLQMFAIDDDFPDKLNPAITYHVQNSSEFRISRDGFVLTNATLNSATSITFLVKAVDETSTQEATTLVYVEVTPFTGPVASTTIATTLPPGTLSKTTRNPPDTTTKTSENNNNSTGTTLKPLGTAQTTTRVPPPPLSSISTAKPSGTKQTTTNTGKPATGIPSGSLVTTTRAPPLPVSSISTTKASGTKLTTINTGKPATGIPSGSLVTTTRVPPLPVSSISTTKASGTKQTTINTGKPATVHFQYTAMDMAALGTSLAVLLFISVIALAFLINKLYRKPKAKGIDNSSGNTNEKGKFGTNDEKSDPTGNEKGVAALNLAFEDEEPSTKEDALNVSSLIELEKEGSSEAALSHQETQKELETDSEMKSILTKERKTDEGYKAVWFQEDIEPDNKDTKEEEGEGEDEEDDEGERNNEEGEEEDDQDDGYDGPWEDHDPIVSFSTQDVTGDTEMNEYTFM